jgi:hypothetical protein
MRIMEWVRSLVTRVWGALARPAAGRRFERGPLDALLYGVWDGPWVNSGPVSREEALTIGTVERGRDLLCSTATIPMRVFRGLDIVPSGFVDDPDPDVARVVVMSQTVEDLLYDGISWWLKTSVDYRGFPLAARRLQPGSVSLHPPRNPDGHTPAPLPSGEDPRGQLVYVDGRPVPAAAVIRFDSPCRPLCTSGARTIRRALLLDRLATMYAENPRPQETFTDTDNATVEPYDDPAIEQFLASYAASRRRGGPAWIPKAVMRTDVSAPSPAELQLVELQRQVSLELALHMGLDPEDVGVNTTSRTYFNAQDRRSDKINMVFSPLMQAITQRLSKPDVTPRGQEVRHDLTEWLRPDPEAQARYWQMLGPTESGGMGVMGRDEIRNAAGLTGPAPAPAALPGPAPALAASLVPAMMAPALTAARLALPVGQYADPAPAAMQFSAADFATPRPPAEVDQERRTVTGLALPYNARAEKYGVGFRFKPGALEYDAAQIGRLRVMDGHTTYVGVHTAVKDSDAGPVVTLKVLDGPEGSPTKMHRDQLLMDAAGGLADGLSVGVDFSLDEQDGDVLYDRTTNTYDVLRATWRETSITPDPAFTGARVATVVASRTGGSTVNCQHCQQPHPAGMACATWLQLNRPAAAPVQQPVQQYVQVQAPGQQPHYVPAQQVAPPAQQYAAPVPPGPQAAAALPDGATSAAALTAALDAHVAAMVAAGNVTAGPAAQQYAAPVNPAALPVPGAAPAQFGAVAQVTEPEPYRITFDRQGNAILGFGSHDLSQDFHAAFTEKDKAAHDRVLGFMQRRLSAMFNVATTDVDELNPTRQRPDMYVDQRDYQYPIWTAINKGTLTDITPFVFPKFSSASGLVAAHTQGTEPSTGTFVTTSQTVTPTAYSGKARINREVWDQKGNPQVSTLVYNQMMRGVGEALEAAATTELNAGSFTALATLTAGVTDRQVAGRVLGQEIEGALALLQFIRGGYRFSDAFAQADLYKALADARDTSGEPIYPILGPSNRNGQAQAKFRSIDVAGQPFDPAWALAAAGQTAATKSYLVDRLAVHGWASTPQKLTMDMIAVAYVDLGVWGYQATAVSDTSGVRTITWDPVA